MSIDTFLALVLFALVALAYVYGYRHERREVPGATFTGWWKIDWSGDERSGEK
jgi:hypothetical protein